MLYIVILIYNYNAKFLTYCRQPYDVCRPWVHTVDGADNEQQACYEASDHQPSHSDQAQHEHHLVAGLFTTTPKDDHARHVEYLSEGNIAADISKFII
jgi:hypothetical protein